jgi:mannose-1-phosphate guanylyltransferase
MPHAVIMAGGAGTRLWPLSRNARPKQLLRLFGGKSLLRGAYERLAALLPPQHIYVITGAKYLPLVARELPELPTENLFGEPQGRDTANAVALSAAILHQREPDCVMGIFTADHVITPTEKFTEAISRAFETADRNPQALVTMGITVRSPETAFGYVKRGKAIAEHVYAVDEFTEKPDPVRAQLYAADEAYYWNSGMFAWRTSAILDEVKTNLPVSYHGVTEIARHWDTPQREDKLHEIYPGLQKISIDFAVMERAREVYVVEMDCNWADVGSWTQLASVLEADAHGNIAVAPRVLNLGSSGVTVVSESPEHLIATVGLKDLVIVHADDATLVCKKRDAQSLKELIARIREAYDERYL